jgi:hypothetical protein
MAMHQQRACQLENSADLLGFFIAAVIASHGNCRVVAAIAMRLRQLPTED